MRIQEILFILISAFMLIGVVQEEVRLRWKRKKYEG